jgi:hypothetical protein
MDEGKPPKRLRLTVAAYRGKDPRKVLAYRLRLALATRIEDWINPQLTEWPRTFTCFDIAEGIGADKEDVREILTGAGYGYNGLTY